MGDAEKKESGRRQRGGHVRERKGRDNGRKTALPRSYYEKINFPTGTSLFLSTISKNNQLRLSLSAKSHRPFLLPPRFFVNERGISG